MAVGLAAFLDGEGAVFVKKPEVESVFMPKCGGVPLVVFLIDFQQASAGIGRFAFAERPESMDIETVNMTKKAGAVHGGVLSSRINSVMVAV